MSKTSNLNSSASFKVAIFVSGDARNIKKAIKKPIALIIKPNIPH